MRSLSLSLTPLALALTALLATPTVDAPLTIASADARRRHQLRLRQRQPNRRAQTRAVQKSWTADQRPLRILSRRGDVYTVADLRTGFVNRDVKRPVFSGHATIDLRKVTKAYYAVQKPTAPRWLGKLADKALRGTATGHAMIFFETADGGVFSTQLPGSKVKAPSKGLPMSGLVYSPEARLKKGQRYGFLRGLRSQRRGGFGQIGMLSGLRERAIKSTEMEHSVVELYRVNDKAIDIKALARNAIEASAGYDKQESYHTRRNNCGTKCAERFEQVGGAKLGRRKWVPSLIPGELAKKGWITSAKPEKVLEPSWRK